MKDVKKNLKVISYNMTKQFLVDCTLGNMKDTLVKTAIQHIPNPAAQTAVKVAGIVAYLVAANHFNKEEASKVEAALYDMFAGKSKEEIENEVNEIMQKIQNESATEEEDA